MANDLEHGTLVADIVAAAKDGRNDLVDLIREHSARISAMRDKAVAGALDAQASFYWEASTLLEPARKAARSAGEEGMEGLLGAQIETMREVSARLRRRAAEIRGVPADEAAARQVLVEPAEVAEAHLELVRADGCPCACCARGTCDCAERPDIAHCSCELCAPFAPPPGGVPKEETE